MLLLFAGSDYTNYLFKNEYKNGRGGLLMKMYEDVLFENTELMFFAIQTLETKRKLKYIDNYFNTWSPEYFGYNFFS